MSGLAVTSQPEEVYAASAFETSLSKFPASYRSYLRELHSKYPNWTFEPLNTGLDWNTVVAAETDPLKSGSGNKSLVAKSASNLLKRNESVDYNAKTGTYIYKDSTSWVSANSNTVAYFLDPRNFLNEVNIFQFEKNSYDSNVHTLEGVKKILAGTFMDYSKGVFSYINTSGKTVSSNTTYAQEIFNAGESVGVSPFYLASKIRQEIGTTASGSVSGNYTSKDGSTKYVGYYNFYNLGANDGTDPIANGLSYAQKTDATALRPWTTPMKSIEGGAIYYYNNYVKTYQNTGYLTKFNVDKRSSYALYTHQYMTNISGAAQETSTTYNAYKNIGVLSEEKVFLIPVYDNMPSTTNNISITSAANKVGTVSGSLNVRSGPGMSYGVVTALSSNTKVTILQGERADTGYSYDNLKNPYWYKIQYIQNGSTKTGYVSSELLNIEVSKAIVKGQTYQIPTKRTQTADTVYYLSSDPAVATVDANGKVTGVAKGEVTIYAFLASGKMDSIKIKVENITLNYSTKKLYINKTTTLKASVSSESKTVTWSTSNKKIATVNSKGKVTAISNGTAMIKAKTASGAYKTCEIIVIPPKAKVSIKKSSYNYVSLKWTKSSYAKGYVIYRMDPGSKSYKKIATITKNSTLTYTDKNVVNGETYKYRVRAYKKVSGKNYYSGYTYAECKVSPRQVNLYYGKANQTKKTALLKWNKLAGSTGYVIYRRAGAKGKYTKIAVIKGNKTFKYTDVKLKKGTTYYYKVKAYRRTNNKNIYGIASVAQKVVVKK